MQSESERTLSTYLVSIPLIAIGHLLKGFDDLKKTMADFNEGKNEKPTDENSVRQVFDWLPDDCEALADGGRQSAIYNQREA